MAVWAYECRPCAGRGEWWVARDWVDTLPPAVQVLRVQAGGGWACGVVDRSRPVAVDLTLLREARVSDVDDCPDCAQQLAAQPAVTDRTRAPSAVAAETPRASHAAAEDGGGGGGTGQIQAAAIALQGQRMLVVLTGLELVRSPGEADMLAADLQSRFGGVAVVLMGQEDDGTPVYHGPPSLLELLADLPVDQLPWKVYPMR